MEKYSRCFIGIVIVIFVTSGGLYLLSIGPSLISFFREPTPYVNDFIGSAAAYGAVISNIVGKVIAYGTKLVIYLAIIFMAFTGFISLKA